VEEKGGIGEGGNQCEKKGVHVIRRITTVGNVSLPTVPVI